MHEIQPGCQFDLDLDRVTRQRAGLPAVGTAQVKPGHRVDITGNQAEPSVRACALDLHLAERSGSRFTDQGIRDRLGLDDLDTYGTAYLVAVSVYHATGGSIDAAMETVRTIHEIDPFRYFHPEMIDSMVVWELGREDDYTEPVADTHVTAWDETTVTTTDEAAQCCHP